MSTYIVRSIYVSKGAGGGLEERGRALAAEELDEGACCGPHEMGGRQQRTCLHRREVSNTSGSFRRRVLEMHLLSINS